MDSSETRVAKYRDLDIALKLKILFQVLKHRMIYIQRGKLV